MSKVTVGPDPFKSLWETPQFAENQVLPLWIWRELLDNFLLEFLIPYSQNLHGSYEWDKNIMAGRSPTLERIVNGLRAARPSLDRDAPAEYGDLMAILREYREAIKAGEMDKESEKLYAFDEYTFFEQLAISLLCRDEKFGRHSGSAYIWCLGTVCSRDRYVPIYALAHNNAVWQENVIKHLVRDREGPLAIILPDVRICSKFSSLTLSIMQGCVHMAEYRNLFKVEEGMKSRFIRDVEFLENNKLTLDAFFDVSIQEIFKADELFEKGLHPAVFTNDNCFCKLGSKWRIRFKGNSMVLPDMDGLTYIVEVIRSQPKPCKANSLYSSLHFESRKEAHSEESEATPKKSNYSAKTVFVDEMQDKKSTDAAETERAKSEEQVKELTNKIAVHKTTKVLLEERKNELKEAITFALARNDKDELDKLIIDGESVAKQLADIAGQLEDLDKELEDHKKNNVVCEKYLDGSVVFDDKSIEDRKKKTNKEQSQKKGRRAKNFSSDSSRYKKLVGKAIIHALTKIEGEDPGLYEHLRTYFLQPYGTPTYKPSEFVEWTIEI